MSDKVVSLFDKKKEKAEEEVAKTENKTKEELDAESYFAEVERKNKEKAEKLRKEKAAANKSVLRSYRIKN